MKKRIIAALLVVCMFALTLISCDTSSGGGGSGNDTDGGGDSYNESYVTVSVTEGEHYTVTSDNPLSVKKGEDALFSIEIEEGYKFVSATSDATYSDGTLTVAEVYYPTTVSLVVERDSVVIVPGGDDNDTPDVPDNPDNPDNSDNSDNPDNPDNPENNDPSEEPEEPEILTKTVELYADAAEEGYHFICWTLDRPITDGGEIISEVDGVSVEIPLESEAVANYAEDGYFVIVYRMNGGMTAEGADFYYQTFSSANYLMPNTLAQNGSFVRDGHVLMRYTEEADGSGDYTTLGGKTVPNGNGFCELWLMWGEVTSSGISYSLYKNENGDDVAAINAYTGSLANIVIPESIEATVDGETVSYAVEKICAGAFSYTDIESVVIPVSVQTVEDGAFSRCSKLKEVTLHDNVWQISDASFDGCDSLTTCYLNAGRAPTHAGFGEGMHVVKYERLRMASVRGEKKIVVMSGSSSVYGFVARQTQEAFDNEYTVVNCGTNASSSFVFYADAYMRFFGEGDIIIQAPETTNISQLGDTEIIWKVLRQCECAYEIFSFVDMRTYNGFFDSICEFNQTVRNTMEDCSYEDHNGGYDEYTDLTSNKDNFSYSGSVGTQKVYNMSLLTEARAENLNAINSRLLEKGAKLYMSFAPVNIESCNSSYITEANMKAYVEKLEGLIDYDVISAPEDYLLEAKYFNNSDYHPGVTGAQIRTERLIADLKAKLIEDGILSEE